MIRRPAPRHSALALLILIPAMGSCSSDNSGYGGPMDLSGIPQHDVAIVQGAPGAGPKAFSPGNTVISLSSQNTVTWFNGDFEGLYGRSSGTPHHLKSDDGTTFESGTIEPYDVFKVTFSAPGVYTYHCEFHPGMTGKVTVNP